MNVYRKQRAFTLVELMICLLIVTVVIVLSIGLQRSGHAQSRQIQCVSNLRQWGQLILLYMADQKGRFPLNDPFQDGKSWNHHDAPLLSYLSPRPGTRLWVEGQSINGCPSREDRSYRYEIRTRYYSYVLNYHLSEPRAAPYVDRITQVPHPSQTVMMADASGDFSYMWTGFSRQQPEAVGAIHQSRLNALFVDGHIDSLTHLDPEVHINPVPR